MGNRIYVGNLAYSITTADLKSAFEQSGNVTDARVMTDKETGQSRGFGFVTFSSDSEAQIAIDQWNGHDLAGRSLVVNEARERTDNRGTGGGGNFRGGGSGGGGSGVPDRGPRGGGGGGGSGGRDRGRRGRDFEDRG